MTATADAINPDLECRQAAPAGRPGRAATSPSSPRGSCSSPSTSATPPTCTPAGACSTSRPAAATPPSPPPGSAATAVGVDYVPGAARARPRARGRRGPGRRARRGRRRGAAVPGRLVRRRHLGLRLDVRPRPRSRRPPSCCASAGPAARSRSRSWTPDGFIGELFRTVGAARPAAAPACQSPMLWGTEAHLRELFGDDIASLEVTERTFTFRFRVGRGVRRRSSARWYGPTLKAFAALEGARPRRARARPVALARSGSTASATGDAIAIPATYIEAVAVKR